MKNINFEIRNEKADAIQLETAMLPNGIYIQTWINTDGKLCAAYGSPNRRSDTERYSFATEEKRAAWVQKVYDSHINSIERRAARKEEGKKLKADAAAAIQVGDIFYTSWGYDQTNIDFFQVIEASGQRVILRMLAAERDLINFGYGKTRPASTFHHRYTQEYRMGFNQSGGYSVDGHYASKWQGEEMTFTCDR